MKIILLAFILSFNIVNAQEQKATKLEYISTNFLDYNFEGIDNVYIFENYQKSLTIVEDKIDLRKKKLKEDEIITIKLETSEREYYFQDKEKQMLFFRDIVIQDIFYVSEKLPIFTWLLINEFKEIENKKLQKATTNFRGRTYTAWCDLDTPIDQGPWKFNNLPGLAYNIIDETPNFYFEWHLRKVNEVPLSEVPFTNPEQKKYLDIKEFVSERAKVYKEFEEKSRARTSIPGLEEVSSESHYIDRRIRSNEIKYEWE